MMDEAPKVHAVALIHGLNGHGILSIESAQAICRCAGVDYAADVAISWQSRQDALQKYGFVANHDAPGQGVDSLDLSYYLCDQLQVEAPGRAYIGRGSQARANARAITQELSRRGRA